jgi:hypothetical protein
VEVHTDKAAEVRTAKGGEQSSRAGSEVRTALVVGSTSTVRGGKYAHSVDLPTLERFEQLTPQGGADEPSPTTDAACAAKPQENRQETPGMTDREFEERMAFLRR